MESVWSIDHRWAEGLEKFGGTALVTDATTFLLDFLPVVHRVLQRQGFVVGHIHYFSNALNPWIAARKTFPVFTLRQDPRDISRIWVEDPHDGSFIELPARSLSQEPATLWEHRAAVKRHHEDGRRTVDEAALARIREDMRRVVDDSVRGTRASRRAAARTPRSGKKLAPPPLPSDTVELPGIAPFEELEQW
jgi:putative transposase